MCVACTLCAVQIRGYALKVIATHMASHTHTPVRPVVRLVTHVREIETNYQDELGLLGQAGTSGMTRDSMLHGTSRDWMLGRAGTAGTSSQLMLGRAGTAGTSRKYMLGRAGTSRTSRDCCGGQGLLGREGTAGTSRECSRDEQELHAGTSRDRMLRTSI